MIHTENYYSATDYYNTTQQNTAAGANKKKADSASSADKTSQTKLSSKAQALLEKLKKTYGNMDFMVADYSSSEEAKNILSRGTKEVSVLFSSAELEKMASDEKYEKEYMNRVESALRMSDQISQQYNSGKNGENGEIAKIGIAFNENGSTSFFAELEKSSAKQREYIEKSREEKRAQKKEDAKKAEEAKLEEYKGNTDVKRTTVQADSIQELLRKMKNIDWDDIKTEKETGYGRKFDFSI